MDKRQKKAFMKTVEAFLAIIVAFTFVMFFMPRDTRTVSDQSSFRLQHLERNDDFRDCVILRDDDCIRDGLDEVFEGRYEFDFVVYGLSEPDHDLGHGDVRSYSWFYAGNRTEYNPTTLRLFYWERTEGFGGAPAFSPPDEDDDEDPEDPEGD